MTQGLKPCNHCNWRTPEFSKRTQLKIIKLNESQSLCTYYYFFTHYCHMKSHHIWQACVIGCQAGWELGARTAAAPWSDSVEGRPVCHSFHSAQQPPSSFSDHKRWLVSEIPLQTTCRKQLIVITLSHGARAPFFPSFSSQYMLACLFGTDLNVQAFCKFT